MTNSGATQPRVLIVSIRRLNTHAAWCSNYAFEDVIRSVDDVDMLELEPGPHFELRQHVARSVAWRGRHRVFQAVNPGVKRVTLKREYDVLVFACVNAWDLLYLNAIADWKSHCKTKLCFMGEIYVDQIAKLENLLRLLQDFDHIFHCFEGSVKAIGRTAGKPCHHLPSAVDVRQFTPYPRPRPRAIDVLSIGNRCDAVHQALRRRAASRDIFYVYDTVASEFIRPSNPVEHREMLASAAQASRFFITYPAKFGDAENNGQSEAGARYFEGAAAGAVLLGQAPTSAAFRRDFPASDAVVEINTDGSDVLATLADLSRRPDELARIGARNAAAALRRSAWGYRWAAMLETVGRAPRAALGERIRALESLAAAIDA